MAGRLLAAALAALAALWALQPAAAAPPCAQVTQMISPCMVYLADRAFVPYGPCCMAVTALDRTAVTQQDRVAVCKCLKSVVPRFPAFDSARASSLPRLCGVNLNVTITPSIDCNSILQT